MTGEIKAMESTQSQAHFDIYIDYVKGDGDPSRVFHAMGELIDTFAQLDQALAGVILDAPQTELVLEDVTAASLKSRLRNVIGGIPDDALKDGEWKKILGHFLVQAKYIVCDWLKENPQITDLDQVQTLQERIQLAAEQIQARHLPIYRPIDNKNLLGVIAEIDRSISLLDQRDTVRYESPYGNIELPHIQHVHEDLIRQLLTKEIIISDDERIVKVKKPDFLGRSQWVLKYAGHSIYASIDHAEWLSAYQSGEIEVKPGDSLRVLMHEEVFYGHNMEVVHVTHSVRRVLEVIGPSLTYQPRIKF
ncbi:hypothetical protein [Luteimonas saliphila]|uniref:hypothetical protein n=1 Tax=Luteimonas saliphila TaxID=2804919 RepID=UPI00192D6B50|nr:hypothetical protein [Luteimonas saliphila]